MGPHYCCRFFCFDPSLWGVRPGGGILSHADQTPGIWIDHDSPRGSFTVEYSEAVGPKVG